MRPTITVARKSGAAAVLKRVAGVQRMSAYVGVPATTSKARSDQLLGMAETKSRKKAAQLRKAAEADVNNAELLFIFTKGSPLRHQPARPVLQPAISAAKNQKIIVRELAKAVRANLHGDRATALVQTKRAALAGQNAARSWFTDAQNGWAPNAPSTIARKGSDRPGIDTGAMRAAITGIVAEE